MAYNNNAYDFDRFAPRTTVAPSREKKAVIKKLPQSKNKSVLNVNTNVIFNAVVAVAVVVLICINILILLPEQPWMEVAEKRQMSLLMP